MDPLQAINLLGSACSIASFWSRRRVWEPTIAQITEALKHVKSQPISREADQILRSRRGTALVSSLLTVSPNLLAVLLALLRRAQETYEDCLRQARTESQRHACDRAAEQLICDILNRIRRRNGGRLPRDKTLQNHWKSFGCSAY